MRHILFFLIPVITLEGFSQQLDFLRPHYQEYHDANKSYGAIRVFETKFVSSDFGPRRIPVYDWHSGIDLTCGNCENDLVLSSLDGSFFYGSSNNVRYVIINGNSDLAYLHLFSSLNAGNCFVMDMTSKPSIKVVLIDYNGQILAFAEEAGQIYFQGNWYPVSDQIQAGQPLGTMGRSGSSAVHLHLEELQDGKTQVSGDFISKNPLQTLHYDSPDYSEINLLYSKTNDVNNLQEGVQINYPGTKLSSILIRPVYPNAIDQGNKFYTLNDINKVQLYLRNVSLNEPWELIHGPNFKSEFNYGGLIGESAYPKQMIHGGSGSFKTTGIYPHAYAEYSPKAYDHFFYADFYHRIHLDDPMKGSKFFLSANCPGDSRYPDGNYEFKSTIQSISGSITEGSTYTAGIDNFQPYIQEVNVLIDGINIYSAFWENSMEGPAFSGYECGSTQVSPNSLITVQLSTSEILTNLQGRIVEFPGNFVAFYPQGGLHWICTFQNFNFLKDGDIAHLEFKGTDIHGNKILDMKALSGGIIRSKKSVKIPIRESNMGWKPGRTGGEVDNVHVFCFKQCHKLKQEDPKITINSGDCIETDDLILSYENESFNGAGDAWIHLEITGGVAPYFIVWTDPQGNIIKQGLNEVELRDLTAATYCYKIIDDHCCELNSCISICPEISVSATLALDHPTTCDINDGVIHIIRVNAFGGKPPYSYSMKDIHGNKMTPDPVTGKYEELFAGKYFVVVSDSNDCSGTSVIELISPQDFYLHPIITKSCNGENGKIQLEAFSDLYPDDTYSFSWSTGFEESGVTESIIDQLSPDKYCVTVTSGVTLCSKIECYEVKGSGKALSLKYSTKIPCKQQNNGEIQLTVSGGTKPYTYKWSNGEFRSFNNNLSAGEYCVTVTDDCLNSITQCINIENILSLDLEMNYLCPDKVNILSSVKGGNPPYSYSWSNGSNVKDLVSVSFGIYKLIVKDNNGCTAEKEINSNPIEFLNPVKPCKGFWDGSITIKINNPNHQEVNVSYDYSPCDDCTPFYKIYEEYAHPVVFTLNDLAGDKEYHFYVTIGNCLFEFSFTLGQADPEEVFNRFDETSGKAFCVYDLVCKDTRIVDGKRTDPQLTHVDGNCKKLLFKECSKTEVRCQGSAEVIKTIPGSKVHMRRLEVIKYAQELGYDPSSLSGNFCDHLWICHDDPFCIITKLGGEFGGKFKGIVKEGDCYRVKCRSFFGLINQDYKICDESFIPKAFLPYYREDPVEDEGGSKPPRKNCTPMTLNFTDVLECWSKYVAEDGKKFYDSEMAKLVDEYRNKRERYCAWVTFCLEDYTIIKHNLKDFTCREFDPPLNWGNWLVYSTCEPRTYKDNDIVFCECNDPLIIEKYGICLEPKQLAKKCTIALKNPTESQAIQFIPFQNGNTFFKQFSTIYQKEEFITVGGIFNDSPGKSYYQKYEPGEIFNTLELFDGVLFSHQDIKKDRIHVINPSNQEKAFEIYSGNYNTIHMSVISSDHMLSFKTFTPFEQGFATSGIFSGELKFNHLRFDESHSKALFLFYRNDELNKSTLSVLKGLDFIRSSDAPSNLYLLKRNSKLEPVIVNGNQLFFPEDVNYLLAKLDSNGNVQVSPFNFISDNIRILDFINSNNYLNYTLVGLAKSNIVIGDSLLRLPDTEQMVIFHFTENSVLWSHYFDPTGIDQEEIFIQAMGMEGTSIGLNVSPSSALFKTHPEFINSTSNDIVVLHYDLNGNLQSENRFGSAVADERLKAMKYTTENVLYLGGDLQGKTAIRSIGDLDLIKSEDLEQAAFISYINFNNKSLSVKDKVNIKPNSETENISILAISPNPVDDQMQIECEAKSLFTLEIFNPEGKQVYISFNHSSGIVSINTRQLSRGLYIIRIRDEMGNTDSKRFIKL